MQEQGTVRRRKGRELLRRIRASYQLYLIIALPLVWLFIFKYIPMYGVQIAFKDFRAADGILGSEWVGLENFIKFFTDYRFADVMSNTVVISVYQLLASFPFPIILALALNNCIRPWYKKMVQLVTYMPHFISTVVLVGMLIQFLSPHVGLVNHALRAMGFDAKDFMGDPSAFSSIYVWSGIWQNCGWGTIIYLAALAGVDYEHHEAAMLDGASRFQRMLYIDLPGIVPTATILLIMNAGSMMNIGFEKAFLLQNNLNRETSEVLSIFVYRIGLASASADFSYAATIGLFNSLLNFFLISIVNTIARRLSNISMW